MTNAFTLQSEINGNLAALNAFSGIPQADLSGFRAPMLNFTADTLTTLHESKFLYDSSATAGTPADATGTDAFWPYTLDNGELSRFCRKRRGCNGNADSIHSLHLHRTRQQLSRRR